MHNLRVTLNNMQSWQRANDRGGENQAAELRSRKHWSNCCSCSHGNAPTTEEGVQSHAALQRHHKGCRAPCPRELRALVPPPNTKQPHGRGCEATDRSHPLHPFRRPRAMALSRRKGPPQGNQPFPPTGDRGLSPPWAPDAPQLRRGGPKRPDGRSRLPEQYCDPQQSQQGEFNGIPGRR